MTPVACPSCGEKGSIPGHLVGKKIKCQKCHASFVAGGAPAPSPAPTDAATSTGDSIEVDGLDPSIWASTAAVGVAVAVAPEAPPREHREPSPAFTASPPDGGPARQYKVLTQKDRFFEGKFELPRLEDALNHYARQGWVVRAMATPHVTGFSGGPREEIVVLLER
jgi:hypothetical protein